MAANEDKEVESLREQLARLRVAEELPAATGRWIDAVLADPAKLQALAQFLALGTLGNRPLRELILLTARHIADAVDDADGGYPDLGPADPGVAPGDDAAGLSGDETSATDSGDDYYARDDSSDGESWSGYSTASSEGEDAIEDVTMRDRLGELQDQLSDLEDGPPGEGLGGGDPPPAKRPRLDIDEAPLEAVEAELVEVEAEIGRHESERERTKAIAGALCAACATYNDLGGPSCAAVDSAERRLEAYWGAEEQSANRGAAARAALLAELAAVRAELDRWCGENPARKRRRDEREALEEIRAEQRNTDEVIDRGAFARLVREVGTEVTQGNYWGDFRIEADAIAALQAAAEDHLVRTLDAANRAAMHAGRTHIADRDIRFADRSP